MTALRKLVSVVCWALLLTSYSVSINAATPDPTTGNLLNLTGTPNAVTGNWVNGVYVDGLTCWKPGDPGNCGPNPNVYRNYNLINFSYGAVDLNQVVNINAALKAAGNNLQVTGFNFGFMAKNGNGWDNGQQDYLSAYVKFYKSNGSLAALYDYTQYTNAHYDWRTFNFSETFKNPSTATGYAAAQFGFIGKDTNNLAGPYGPEIQGVNFNLKYRVDPCATDPTSSPACPGFASAMSSKTPTVIPATPAPEPIVDIATPVTVSTTAKTEAAAPALKPPSRTVATALNLIAKNQQQTQALQTAVAQAAIAEAAATAEAAQQQAVNVAASLATMSQTQSAASIPAQRQSTTTAAAPVAGQTTMLAPPAPNSATSANNENKSAPTANTVQMPAPRASTPVVTNTALVTSTVTVDTQQFSPPSLQSYFARSQPATAPTVQETVSTPPPPPTNNSKTVATTPQAIVTAVPVTTQNTTVFAQQDAESQQASVASVYIQPQNIMFYNMTTQPVEQQQQPTTVQPASTVKPVEAEAVNSNSTFLTNRADPLNAVVDSKPVANTTNTVESNQTVRATVANNELAGGVDIGKLAVTPAGYSSYTNLVMKDGKMYEPREIYKNQTPVDNARALRQLSTDRLHQQMIEQQYRR
jgi:hypothetical protein